MHNLDMNCERFAYLWRHFHLTEIDLEGIQEEEEEEEDGHAHHGDAVEEDAIMMEPVQTHCYQN
eukprot:15062036-Ditylum_brightwellii.AAC.1